jgi:hypothetical protein
MTFIHAVVKNPTRSIRTVPKGSAVQMIKGYVLAWSSGLATLGVAGTTRPNVIGICNQDIAVADALTQVEVIETFEKDVWIADTTNNSNAAHNGQYMVLGANGGIVNNTGTTDTAGIVQQVGVYGAAADKKILVQFVAQ